MFVFSPFLTKLGQIAVLMSTAIWPSLVKIGLKTRIFYQYAKFWQDPFLNCCDSRVNCIIMTRAKDFFEENLEFNFWNSCLLEARKFKKGVLLKFCILIKFFCFQSNHDQSWSDCSTHEYCNLTKFGQDWTENKNFLSVCKILVGPLLKFRRL